MICPGFSSKEAPAHFHPRVESMFLYVVYVNFLLYRELASKSLVLVGVKREERKKEGSKERNFTCRNESDSDFKLRFRTVCSFTGYINFMSIAGRHKPCPLVITQPLAIRVSDVQWFL